MRLRRHDRTPSAVPRIDFARIFTFANFAHPSVIWAGNALVWLSMAGCACVSLAEGHGGPRFHEDNAYGAAANALEEAAWRGRYQSAQGVAIFGALLVICGLLARRVQQHDAETAAATSPTPPPDDDPPTGQTEKGAPAAHWALPPERRR